MQYNDIRTLEVIIRLKHDPKNALRINQRVRVKLDGKTVHEKQGVRPGVLSDVDVRIAAQSRVAVAVRGPVWRMSYAAEPTIEQRSTAEAS
jgi:hypothetical protein